MKYVSAIIMKFLMTFIVLFVFLSLFNDVSLFHVFMMSLIITGIGFILGDLIILPAFENWGATLADFFLIVITIRVYSSILLVEPFVPLSTIGLAALIISAGEVYFHIYMDRKFLNVVESVDSTERVNMSELQTEFGDEFETKKED